MRKICRYGLMTAITWIALSSAGILTGCSGGWGSGSPTVTMQQGTSQSVTAGSSATFTAITSGAGPFTYQWYVNGTLIAGATSSSYTVSSVTGSMNGNVYTVVVTSPGGTAKQSSTLKVTQITPTITTWPTASSLTYGQTLASSTLTGGAASVSGTFSWANSATAPTLGTSTQSVVFTPTDTTEYVPVTGSVSVTVAKATPTVTTWPTASSLMYGQTLASSTLSGGAASVAGTFSWTSSATTPAAGTSEQSVTFTPTDTVDYDPLTGMVNLTTSGVTLAPIASTVAANTTEPGTYSFSTTASGGVTNALTWSATGGSITSAGVWTSPTTPGTYTITATSAEESTVSVSTTVTISKPVITAQPVSKTACAGYRTTLQTSANYADGYQWTLPGSASGYTGASTSTLVLSNLTTNDSGTYACTVSNLAGTVSTNNITLNVVNGGTAPTISSPSNATVWTTQTATFSTSVSGGTGTMSYQWYKNTTGSTSIDSSTKIAGATKSLYTTGALSTSDSGTYFFATVTDADCTNSVQTTSAALLTVNAPINGVPAGVPPSIVTQPTGETGATKGSATFSVTASGTGTLSYQWYYVPYSASTATTYTAMSSTAGIAISGATSSSYTTTSSDNWYVDGDQFYVVVTNNYGQAVSNKATLAVGAGMQVQIDDQPQSEYIASAGQAAFTVTATCTDCTPAYQWYWMAPEASTAVALTDSTATTATGLSGATISGSTTSSITISNTPSTASGGILYAVISSTDGVNVTSGTHALTSSKAGLFVGSVGSIGASGSGKGLCNTSSAAWVLNGTMPGTGSATTSSAYAPYQDTTDCQVEMTNDQGTEQAAIFWPTLVSAAKFSVSFTVQIAHSSSIADGFTLVLADPSSGATTSSVGATGGGLGAKGIPGFVLGFDTYYNSEYGDPSVPYLGVGRGETALWEKPWSYVNTHLAGKYNSVLTDFYNNLSEYASSTHDYVVTVDSGVMTVTMDGYEVFSGSVTLPQAAYLGFTASTGGSMEEVIISNLTATVSQP